MIYNPLLYVFPPGLAEVTKDSLSTDEFPPPNIPKNEGRMSTQISPFSHEPVVISSTTLFKSILILGRDILKSRRVRRGALLFLLANPHWNDNVILLPNLINISFFGEISRAGMANLESYTNVVIPTPKRAGSVGVPGKQSNALTTDGLLYRLSS